MLTAAGWDQTAGHRRHPFCAYFQKRFELNILNILKVKRATHCLQVLPLEVERALDGTIRTKSRAYFRDVGLPAVLVSDRVSLRQPGRTSALGGSRRVW